LAKGQREASDKQLALSNNYASQAGNRAQGIFDPLNSALMGEVNNPQGYSTADMNSMRTGSAQALGGSTAGITGQANLQTARTRNSAGYSGALDSAARSSAQTASQNEMGLQAQNANLKEAQRQQGLSALQGLYGTNMSSMNSALGLGPGTLQARAAGPPPWWQSVLGTAAGVGGAAIGR